MNELIRIACAMRRDAVDPGKVFNHRVRIGILVAVLILTLSNLR